MSEIKFDINLYRDELIPAKPWLSFTKLVAIFIVVAIGMTVITVSLQTKQHFVTKKHQALIATQQQQQQLMTDLEQKIKQHRPDAKLALELEQLTQLIRYKQALKNKLTDNQSMMVKGFAPAMTTLAQHYSKDISLQKITLSNDGLQFAGLARNPDAVPNWLASFDKNAWLSGVRFSELLLTEQGRVTEFKVNSHATAKGANNGQ